MRFLYVLPTLLLLGACGTTPNLDLLKKAADVETKVENATLGNAMKALPPYCKVPDTIRSAFRDRANSQPTAGGNKLGVWCVGDPPLTLGPDSP